MPPGPILEQDYEPIWQRLQLQIEQECRRLSTEREAAPALLAELLDLRPAERYEALRRDGRFHSVGLADTLIRQGRARGAAELLRTALELLPQLAQRAHPSVLQVLRGEAFLALGEIAEASGDLTRAEISLTQATRAFATSPDPSVRVRCRAFRSRLRNAHGARRSRSLLSA